MGLFIGGHVFTFSALFFGSLAFWGYFFWGTSLGKHILSRFLSHLPVVRTIYRQMAIQRFVSTMALLMKAGLPIMQTIEVTADAVGSEEFRYSLLRISREGLAKGLTMGEAFRRETVFPKVVANLVAISEKAGHLEDVLATLSDFYSANVDASVKSLVSVVEPFLIIGMGGIVVVIAVSILVPIYQLTTQF